MINYHYDFILMSLSNHSTLLKVFFAVNNLFLYFLNPSPFSSLNTDPITELGAAKLSIIVIERGSIHSLSSMIRD